MIVLTLQLLVTHICAHKYITPARFNFKLDLKCFEIFESSYYKTRAVSSIELY